MEGLKRFEPGARRGRLTAGLACCALAFAANLGGAR